MDTFLGSAAVVMTTIIALFTAMGLQALLLRATLALMQPATAARRIALPSMERGTQLVARAFAKGR
jgi:hypothetical protein